MGLCGGMMWGLSWKRKGQPCGKQGAARGMEGNPTGMQGESRLRQGDSWGKNRGTSQQRTSSFTSTSSASLLSCKAARGAAVPLPDSCQPFIPAQRCSNPSSISPFTTPYAASPQRRALGHFMPVPSSGPAGCWKGRFSSSSTHHD